MLNRIFVDFNNADEQGRVRLNTSGTLEDLRNKKIELNDGIEILLDDSDGLVTTGTIQFSKEENIWVALIDWDKLKPRAV